MRVAVFILFLIIILSIRFFIYFHTLPTYKPGDRVRFTTILFEDPNVSFGKQTVKWGGLQVEIPVKVRLHYGSVLRVEGRIDEKEIKDKKTGKTNTSLFVKTEKVSLVKNNTSKLLAVFQFIRQRIKESFSHILPDPYGGLLIGIVFGIKDISFDFHSKLQTTGVLHVIAASGMNVTMVGGFFLSFFTRVFRRQIGLVMTILGIIFYAILSGLEPSIVRAAIMAIFAYSAQVFGRQNYSYLALFFACFLMLFYNPGTLFEVGFQLSVAATWGILSIKPMIEGLGYRVQPFQGKGLVGKNFISFISEFVGDDFSTTLAAQIATLPILLFAFGTYSLLSIPVNLLVLWTVPYLMVLGGVGAGLSFIHEIFTQLFLYVAFPLLLYFKLIIDWFSSVSTPVEVGNIPWSMVVGYYCLLFSGLLILRRRKQKISNS